MGMIHRDNIVHVIANNNIGNEVKWLFEDVLSKFSQAEFLVELNSSNKGILIKNRDILLESNGGFILEAVNLQDTRNLYWKLTDVKSISDTINLDYLINSQVPVLDSGTCLFFKKNKLIADLGDVFGTMFVVLSRYEEFLDYEGDLFDRFSSRNCLHKDFLDRPFIDEWCWILVQLLGVSIDRPLFKILPSHDIDFPSIYNHPPLWRRCASLFKKCIFIESLVCFLFSLIRVRNSKLDCYDKTNWIIQESNKRNLKSSFYYIPITTCKKKDGIVNVNNKIVQEQWKKIYASGHELGIHPGFETYNCEKNMVLSFEQFKKSLSGFKKIKGGRQHYLRWSMRLTTQLWEKMGVEYDSSLGFADRAGFRCGSCYDYRLYDVVGRRPYNLLERPLILMDCTLMDRAYMGLGNGEEALRAASSLKEACRRVGGNFTILWHNTRLICSKEKSLYLAILDQ